MSASAETVVDVRSVAEVDPAIDLGAIEDVRRILRELVRVGVTRRGYEIASPYVRRPMRKILRPGTDPSG